MVMQNQKQTGWIIAISEEVFSLGKSHVQKLAHVLGFRFVDEAIVIERAAAHGIEQKRLRALWTSPHFCDRVSRSRYRHTRVLQAALAAEISGGNVVCFGHIADLLTVDAPGVIRMLITCPQMSRVRMAADRLKIRPSAAQKLISRSDHKDRSWRRYVFHAAGPGRANEFDLIVNLEHMSIDELYDAVGRLTLQPIESTANHDAIEDFVLSSQIAASLALNPATSHLEVNVIVKGGDVTLRGDVSTQNQLAELRRVARSVTTGIVDVGGVRISPSEITARFIPHVSSQQPVRALLGLSALGAAAALLFGVPWWATRQLPSGTPLQTFLGVVTDTLCPDHHQKPNDANCIRACVKTPGVRYALFDGSRSYVISDQGAAEALAAQEVVVRGTVDQKTGILKLDSIQAR